MADAWYSEYVVGIKGYWGGYAGTGVLIAPGKILTCAHVVAAALDSERAKNEIEQDSAPPQIPYTPKNSSQGQGKRLLQAKIYSLVPEKEKIVSCTINSPNEWRKVDLDMPHGTQDLALLSFQEETKSEFRMFMNLVDAEDKQELRFFGFGEQIKTHIHCRYNNRDDRRSLVNVDYEKILVSSGYIDNKTDESIWAGCSGAGVFSDAHRQLVGMLCDDPQVAKDVKSSLSKISAAAIRKFLEDIDGFDSFLKENRHSLLFKELRNPEAITGLLVNMVNRKEQLQAVSKRRIVDKNVFLVESKRGDSPEHFVKRLVLHQFFEKKDWSDIIENISEKELEIHAKNNECYDSYRFFSEKDLSHHRSWECEETDSAIVYVDLESPFKAVKFASDTVGLFHKLEKGKLSLPKIKNRKIMVVVVFFPDKVMFIKRLYLRLVLLALKLVFARKIIYLKKLGLVQLDDLKNYWKGVPTNVSLTLKDIFGTDLSKSFVDDEFIESGWCYHKIQYELDKQLNKNFAKFKKGSAHG